MNVASSKFGEAPTVKSCNEGKWREHIDKSGEEHEAFVILDDRDHKKGDLYGFVTQQVNGAPPSFPIVFVLDHNGRVINKSFQGFTFPAALEAVEKQEKVYDKALKAAKSSKKDASGEDKEDKDDKDSSESEE